MKPAKRKSVLFLNTIDETYTQEKRDFMGKNACYQPAFRGFPVDPHSLRFWSLPPIISGMQEDNMTDAGDLEESPINRRKHLRSVFTYPVEFELLSQKPEGMVFAGYLKDISVGGAGLEIDDPYGRFSASRAENGTVRLTVKIPRENRIHIFAHVQWVRKGDGTSQVKMGLSFKDLDYETSKVIEKLIGLKGKDHTMMWNLWEQLYQ